MVLQLGLVSDIKKLLHAEKPGEKVETQRNGGLQPTSSVWEVFSPFVNPAEHLCTHQVRLTQPVLQLLPQNPAPQAVSPTGFLSPCLQALTVPFYKQFLKLLAPIAYTLKAEVIRKMVFIALR